MICRVADLRLKEVINTYDGCRLGYVCDVEIDTRCGVICAIVIPGRLKFFGLFGREDDIVVKWGDIQKIGSDLILVCLKEPFRKRREAKRFSF